MAVKIRLQRHGRKRYAFYHIVVADSRSPRDGRFVERIGSYNPNTNPATINLEFDKALTWLTDGAQPTDTCRAILSYKGVLMKKHLLDGAKKGAFTVEVAEQKFEKWLQSKEAQVTAKKASLELASSKEGKERLAAEAKVNAKRAEDLAKQSAAAAAKAVAAPAEESAAEGEESAEA